MACFDKTLKNLSVKIMIVMDYKSLDKIGNLWLSVYKNIFKELYFFKMR